MRRRLEEPKDDGDVEDRYYQDRRSLDLDECIVLSVHNRLTQRADCSDAANSVNPPIPPKRLAQELCEWMEPMSKHHVVEIGDCPCWVQDFRWVLEALWPEAAQVRDSDLLSVLFKDAAPLAMVLVFSKFWLRPLRDWKVPAGEPTRKLRSLVKHLFVNYPVPQCLYNNWNTGPWHQREHRNVPPDLKWLLWLILIGQGASLHKAAVLFNWNIPKNYEPKLFCTPPTLTPVEACMWVEIGRLGGTEVEFKRLKNLASTYDPTAIRDRDDCYWEKPGSDFWRDTVRWLIRYRDQLTDETSAVILEWAMHMYSEGTTRRLPPFSWKGRTPGRAQAAGLEYQQALSKPWAGYQWQAHNWDMEYAALDGTQWSVVELTSGEQLFEEGTSLHHCVATYAPQCAAGHSAVFSLRREGQRSLTIEVDPRSKRIIQIRGTFNRSAIVAEQTVINQWYRNVIGDQPPIDA